MLKMRKFAMLVCLILCLAGPIVLMAQTSHRPIEDFINAQATPVAWVNSNDPLFIGSTDFGGTINKYLVNHNCGQPDFGSTFSGDITEKPLDDGRTQVHVVAHGKNVYMRAFLNADSTPVLGSTPAEICAGAAPMLGDYLLTLDFINNQGVGGPLPDLIAIGNEPGTEFQSILVNASARAPVRFLFNVQPGTPGFMHILQRGPYVKGKGVPGHDYYPAELVDVKANGK